jgi:hypothetical protein
MTYAQYNSDGSIQATASWPAPGMVKVDYEVVRGYDGKLYKADEAPEKPQELIEAEAFASLRAERDKRLADTDYLIMPDYPIDADKLDSVKVYRQALRDLPQQDGAPWIGGEIPWPVMGKSQEEWDEVLKPAEETEEVVEAEVEGEPDAEKSDA